MSDFSPGHACDPFGFVDRCTVSSFDDMPCSTADVSDATRTRFPPSDMKNRVLPSRIACNAATVSMPFSRGTSNPKRSCSASRKCAGIFSQIPTVRLPCTFEWPRSGAVPAPGLPMLPVSSSVFTISRIVYTASRCWVTPRVHVMMTLCAFSMASTVRRTSSRVRPQPRRSSSSSSPRRCSRVSSNPVVNRSMKSWSRASRRMSSLFTAWKNARSPSRRTCR